MAELEVIIGGDSRDLAKEIDKVEKQLRELTAQKRNNIKLGLDNSEVILQINQAKKELKGYTTQLNSTANASQNFSKATANGSNTLTQFSRIAQDAPFGIMGIGNNLTATAESFANLSKSSGGAVNALKAVGSSLLGGGGVLLAISLVTTGLTYMSQSGLTVGDVFDKLTGKFDANAKALKDIYVEAAKTSGEEISSLKSLVSVAQDDTLSREKRLIAVRKLQDEYPAYFGNLNQEKILNGDVSKAIDGVSTSLKARARANAIVGKIGELSSQRLDLEQQREAAITKLKEAQNASEKDTSIYAAGLRFDLKAAVDAYKDIVKEIKNIDAQINKLQSKATVDIGESIILDKEKPKAATKAKKQGNTNEPIIKFRSELQPITADQLKPFDNAVNEALTFGIIQNVAVQTDELLQLLVDFDAEASQLIQGSLTDTFNGLGDAIGNALSTGGNVLNAVGNSLLASFGSFLSDMGGLLIKYGTLAVLKGKLDLAIAAGGPVSIAAGIAAIAVGVALKAAGAAIGNAARGGSTGGGGGGGSTGRDYTSPASSVSTGGGGSGFTNGSVVFEISGTSLIGVLSNSLDKNSRLGGTLGI